MAKDFYNILGVPKDASEADIKKAFRKLAHEHHPDKDGGDEEKFKEINEAYQTLSNKEKRQQYDQFGQTFDQARRQGGGPGGFGGFSAEDFARGGGPFGGFRTENANFDFGDLGDIFGDIFGMGGSRGRARSEVRRGNDAEISVTVSLHEAAFGTDKVLTLEKEITCKRCGGSGADPGAKIVSCATCGGSGQVQNIQQTFFGALRQMGVCPECHGEGRKASKKCTVCHGEGRTTGQETISVKIPAGISDGESLRLSGKGAAGVRGAEAGDLFVRIKVPNDPNFRREGDDIYSDVSVGFSQAALGTKVHIETLDGEVILKIPHGTQSGKVFRLDGKGVTHLRKRGRGDHLVTVQVETPAQLSRREKDLLKELADLRGEDIEG